MYVGTLAYLQEISTQEWLIKQESNVSFARFSECGYCKTYTDFTSEANNTQTLSVFHVATVTVPDGEMPSETW